MKHHGFYAQIQGTGYEGKYGWAICYFFIEEECVTIDTSRMHYEEGQRVMMI